MAFLLKNGQGNRSNNTNRAASTDNMTSNSNRVAGKPENSYNTARNKGPKKDRPYCTYCNYSGHTVDKCYKFVVIF